jgi:uncharacterized secreted protein with C-terminal beta-propeller domain
VVDATITPTNEREQMTTTMESTEMQDRIKQLEEHISKVTQRSYTESAERNRMRNEMQEWTLEQLDEDSITESQAEEIASICEALNLLKSLRLK